MRIALLAVLSTGCLAEPSTPQALVICHNANCARATDPFADDTLATLDESLRLEYRGRPAIDGVEIDILWDRATNACVFAHDLLHVIGETGTAAAERIADHLRRPGPVSWRGDSFFVKIELKGEVDLENDTHAPDELAAHIACAYDMADTIAAAAVESGRELELGFDSAVVPILRAVAAHPRWPGKAPAPGVMLRLISNVHAVGLEPRDLESLTEHADDGIDTLAFHATRTPTGIVDGYAALGADLMLWMLDAAPETLQAVEHYQPRLVNTSEALLFRRWFEQ